MANLNNSATPGPALPKVVPLALQVLGILFLPLGIIIAIYLVRKSKSSGSAWLYLRAGLIIILSLAVSLIYAVAYQRFTVQPYKYTYNSLDSYKLSYGGSSLELQKPKEFLELRKRTGGQFAGVTLDSSKNTKDPAGVVYLTVSTGNKLDQNFYNSVNSAMKNAKGTLYDGFVKSTQEYIKDFVPSGYQLELAKPTPFTNRFVKSNAWQFNFTITRLKKVGLWANTRNLDVKGKMIYIFRDSTIYDMAARDSGGIWDNNQAVWGKVFDSLDPK
jgi:hypothetical protein